MRGSGFKTQSATDRDARDDASRECELMAMN